MTLMSTLCRSCWPLRRKDDVPTLGNLWPRRDYVHVDDVADALMSLSVLKPGYHVYNVVHGRRNDRHEPPGDAWMAALDRRSRQDARWRRASCAESPQDSADTGWIARHSLTEVLAA